MSAQRKKSFFELLTGTPKPDDSSSPEPTKDIAKPVSLLKKDYQELKAAENTKTEIPLQHNASRQKPNGPFSHEELSTEEEGQLTIDVYQTEDEIVIKSPVAGVNSDDLDVNIANDMITIKGRRENDERIPEDDYYFQELYWGPFSRSVILPTEVEADKVRAILKNGILTIRLPKVKRETIRKIEIKTE